MLISIVIPTYNRQDLITKTIDSVLQQTFEDWELIIIDDGSTDQTSTIIQPYLTNPKITYVYQKNSERGAARNRGIRMAKGEFIAFLDSDDIWNPNHLKNSLAVISKNENCGLVWSGIFYINELDQKTYFAPHDGPMGKVFLQLLKSNYLPQSTVVARKFCFEKVGYFNEDRVLSGSEDWEMWLRIAVQYEIQYVKNNYSQIRIHSENATQSKPDRVEKSILSTLQCIQKNSKLQGHIPEKFDLIYASNFKNIAMVYFANGHMKKSREMLRMALKKNPPYSLHFAFWYYYLRTFLGRRVSHFLHIQKFKLLSLVQQRN